MSWRIKVIALAISLLLASSIIKADEQQGDRKQIERVLEQAHKLSETMRLSENSHTQEGLEAARQAAEQFQSPDFQEKLRCQMDRIQRCGPPQEQAMKEQGESTLTAQESVYLFLSSSVPEAVVNRYLSDIDRTGEQRITPVLFGLPHGVEGRRLDADYFARVMQANTECRDTPESPCHRLEVPLKVNPELFTRYNISEVPTLVYANGQDSWSIRGEAELAFLLEKAGKAANSPALAGISARLRGGQ